MNNIHHLLRFCIAVRFLPLALAISLLVQLSTAKISFADDPWEAVPLSKVSELDLPANSLPGEWTASAGLRIDDLKNLKDLAPEKRQATEPIAKQLLQIGVRSAADYTLTSKAAPLNTVTVRLFIFESPEKCRAWWKKKYEYKGSQKHYQQLDSKRMVLVKSLQTNKNALGFANVWLTTHQLGKGDEHLQAADFLVRRLTSGKRSLFKQ